MPRKPHPLLKVWEGMKSRCHYQNSPSYKHYGGRGIIVCNRWMRFENFVEDMGNRPPGTTIDRINNDGNYEPENCRWATMSEQHRNYRQNRMFTLNGDTQCATEWASRLGISIQSLMARIDNMGWSIEKALTTSTSIYNNRKFITFRGETKTTKEWAIKLGMHHTTLRKRINRIGVDNAFSVPVQKHKVRTNGN